MAAIHQFVPTYEPGAVGAHMLEVQRLALDLGFESEVFAEHLHPTLESGGRHYREYGRRIRSASDDVLIYQTAIGSPVADFVLARRATLAVNYHNITPPGYFAAWEPQVVPGLVWGRSQLAGMSTRAAIGIAVSSFNEQELNELGYRRTEVVPVLIDVSRFDVEVDQVALDQLSDRSDGRTVWLFVGRLAPNKAQHDLIKAFAAYRRTVGSDAVLRIVGGSSSGAYRTALRAMVHALDLDSAVEFTGAVTAGQLIAHYRVADVFVCLSEHEGFCVPLLEAMYHRLPIVAYAAAAVPETLGGAGLCLPAKDPALVAAAVERVMGDMQLRSRLVELGTARLGDFDAAVTRPRMAAVLRTLIRS